MSLPPDPVNVGAAQSKGGREYDAEAMFLYWYNDGERRTMTKVAEQFGSGYNTVRRYADEDDWEGRAEDIDRRYMEQVNKQLASTRARRVVRSVSILDAIETRFLKRLSLPETDPDYLSPGDVDPNMVMKIAETRDKLLGGVTHRIGIEGGAEAQTLSEIEAEIAQMDQAELEKGDG